MSGGLPRGPVGVRWPSRRVGSGREALFEGHKGLECLSGGLAVVGRPCKGAGRGRVALPQAKEGW